MVVVLAAAHKVRFVDVGDDARLAVAAALLRAHPILAIEARLGTEKRMALVHDFARAALPEHILHRLDGGAFRPPRRIYSE